MHLRTHNDALAVNDTDFIHVDFTDGKRVLVWQRGQTGSGNCVVVVANFSDFASVNFSDFASVNLGASGDYRVLNWPTTPSGSGGTQSHRSATFLPTGLVAKLSRPGKPMA